MPKDPAQALAYREQRGRSGKQRQQRSWDHGDLAGAEECCAVLAAPGRDPEFGASGVRIVEISAVFTRRIFGKGDLVLSAPASRNKVGGIDAQAGDR